METTQTLQPTEPKPTNWPKITLAAVLGFGLLTGATYAGYWYGIESSKLKSQSAKPQVETQSEGTTSWKTYTNTKYGYAINYPPIPETHFVEAEGSLTLYLSTQAPQLTLVIKTVKSTNPSLEEVIERTINRNCCNITKEELDFKGVPAMKGIHIISGPETMSAYFEYLVFVKDQNEYTITVNSGVEELSEQHRTLVDQILSTFKFLD